MMFKDALEITSGSEYNWLCAWAPEPITQTITSGSEQRMNVPAVTVDGFFNDHAKALQLKLEGSRAGFGRRIREPTINRPGLALAGFYEYFAEKRVQVLGAAEQIVSPEFASTRQRQARFRALCEQNPPSRRLARFSPGAGFARHRGRRRRSRSSAPDDHDEVHQCGNHRGFELDFSPTVTEFGSMVDILGVGVTIRGASGVGI